jgi:hypothetical protein
MSEASVSVDDELLVLLTVKGAAGVTSLSNAVGLHENYVLTALERLRQQGLIVLRQYGTVSRYVCSRYGTARVARTIVPHYSEAYPIARRQALYQRFTEVNLRFKEVVTSIQLESVGQGALSWKSIMALARINSEARDILDTMSNLGHRYIGYMRRLGRAHAKIEQGNLSYLAASEVDSYHSIWFEWHEDLIITFALASRK